MSKRHNMGRHGMTEEKIAARKVVVLASATRKEAAAKLGITEGALTAWIRGNMPDHRWPRGPKPTPARRGIVVDGTSKPRGWR